MNRSEAVFSIDYDDPRLAELVDAITNDLQSGRSPDLERYSSEYSEYAERLQGLVAAVQAVVDLGESFPGAGISHSHAVTASETPTRRLGDFRIVQEIGRGGMGIVYEAEQISIGRRVALKVLPFAALLSDQQLHRFQNEVRAAGSLNHPHIVGVHSVGSERGVHFYAMQFVEGRSLATAIGELHAHATVQHGDREHLARPTPHSQDAAGERRSQLDTQPIAALSTIESRDRKASYHNIARLGIQAAEALHYAHQQGVVHRDIKPANLLLDAENQLYVTDFGLARIEADAGVTMTGDLLGTLRYMSPEQATGNLEKIDYRTDIYSLGITLYELVTGQPAFSDEDRRTLLRHVIEDEPRRPRSLVPAVPRDLETILLTATAKEPADRYGSAKAFADDLSRFCDDKPILARRSSRVERIWRWSRRNRLVAALAVTLATLITAVAIIAPLIAWQQARLIDRTQRQLYAKDLALAYKAWDEGNLGQARDILNRYADGTRHAGFRDFSWYLLHGSYQRSTTPFMQGGQFAISDTANLAAVVKSGRLIDFHALDNWEPVSTLPLEDVQRVGKLSFSPDGRLLAVAGRQTGKLSVWDVAGRTRLYTIQAEADGNRVYSPSFSPDGKLLTSGSHDADIRIWSTDNGEPHQTLKGHRARVRQARFSPCGHTLATGSDGGSIRLWNTQTWECRAAIELAHQGRISAIAFDPSGRRIASAGGDDRIRFWDSSTSDPLFSLQSTRGVSTLCFSHDGRLLAAGSQDNAVRVWDVDQQLMRRVLAASVPDVWR